MMACNMSGAGTMDSNMHGSVVTLAAKCGQHMSGNMGWQH